MIKRDVLFYLPDKETLDILETICICEDKANNEKNVNYNFGGWVTTFTGGWNKGITTTNKQKEKISKALKGREPWNKGKKLSEDHKKKISKNSAHISGVKGKKLSEETKTKMSESHRGKKHSEEWNKKVGEAQKGKSKSKESIEKMRATKLGKKISEEHKEKISKGMRGLHWWNNGVTETKSKECPEGFVKGRLK